VRPGASADRIRVRVRGASALSLDSEGALVASTGLGPITFTAPNAYQERDGVRHHVPVAYRLMAREYRFIVGSYDPALPLVIDPLLQSTYLGGIGSGISTVFGDAAFALGIHPTTGDVYVAGSTGSSNFPGTAGGAQPAIGNTFGFLDAFVARLPRTLTSLTQATYLGGSSFDEGYALAIHPTTGDVYVAGSTASSNFPGTTGGAQPANGGAFGFPDAFVARFPRTLTSLTQATYLGGSDFDEAYALAIHPATGDVYVAGRTDSSNFPGTAGGAQPAFGGASDAFIVRLPSTLTSRQSTFLGGSGGDVANALAIHPTTGDVYVAGRTTRSDNFPGTAGGAQPAFAGGFNDAFVARFARTLTSLTQATYLGGSDSDQANALAIHPATGDVYVAGLTNSGNFPGTAGGVQPAIGNTFGFLDAFVARLPRTLTSLTQATYLGGGDFDRASALAIHPITGDVYVTGDTRSGNFPGTAGGVQPAIGGGPADAFIARLPSSLTALTQATYLGGSSSDGASALAIHPTTADVYVAGGTDSSNFPGTAGGAQPVYGGGADAFVARLTFGLALADPPLAIPTLSEWALFVLVALLLMTGLLAVRRRRRWAR
jgi:hypothetical protein